MAESHLYPDLKRLRIAAGGMALAQGSLVTVAMTVVLAFLYWQEIQHILLPILITEHLLCAIGLVISLVAATPLRCPNCGNKVVSEPLGGAHADADRAVFLNTFATAMLRVLRGEPITCVHCAAVFDARVDGDPAAADRIRQDLRKRRQFNGKPAEVLLVEHRVPILAGHTALLLGLGSALVLYRWAAFASTDWRPGAVDVGLALSMISPAVGLTALFRGKPPREAIAAYVIEENMTLRILDVLTAIGVLILVVSLASLSGGDTIR
jgi:hypothetical protein